MPLTRAYSWKYVSFSLVMDGSVVCMSVDTCLCLYIIMIFSCSCWCVAVEGQEDFWWCGWCCHCNMGAVWIGWIPLAISSLSYSDTCIGNPFSVVKCIHFYQQVSYLALSISFSPFLCLSDTNLSASSLCWYKYLGLHLKFLTLQFLTILFWE